MRITNSTGGKAILGIAVAAALTASVTGASAHIPGVGNGAQQTTDAPDLRSVSIDAADLRRVRFCFDQPINGTPVQNAFFVQTYDSKRYIQSISAKAAADNQACVLAIMGSAADLAQGTIGSVSAGAVSDAASRSNVSSTEPLGGSAATPVGGRTTGPDLIGAARDVDSKSIVFTFDENMDPALYDSDPDNGSIDPGNFSYVDDKGFLTPGSAVVSAGGNAVRVSFPDNMGGGTVAGAAGAFAAAGAVRDAPQSGVFVTGTALTTPSPTGAISYGDNAARTKLTSVVSDGPRQLRLTYSNSVNSGNNTQGRITAVLDDGTTVTASKLEDVGGANQIRATFATGVDITADPTALVAVTDRGAAVATDDSEGLGSLPATVGVGAATNAPGFTNGPDLVRASNDPGNSRVNYAFDETVGAATSGGFFVTAPSGSASSTTGSNNVSGGNVAVTFGSSANSSVAAGVSPGAAADPLGNPAPQSAVAYATEQAPSTTPPGTTTPTTTTPITAPPTTTVARKKYRTSFSSFKVRSSTRYSGRITSSGRGCKSGRRIALKKSGHTIRNGFTKGDGTFSIKRSSGTKGSKGKGVYVVVTERTTSTLTCTARGSKKLKKG